MKASLIKIYKTITKSNLIDMDMRDSHEQFNDFRTGDEFADFRSQEDSPDYTYKQNDYPDLITPDKHNNQFVYYENNQPYSRYDEYLSQVPKKPYPDEVDQQFIKDLEKRVYDLGDNPQGLKVHILEEQKKPTE